MKKPNLRQIISGLLLLCLLVSMIPTAVFAQEDENAQIDTGALTVEGTTGFGKLLSNEIQQYQEATYSGDYLVTALTVENGVATVKYDCLDTATLVVSLYTEDGIQLLASGKKTLEAGSGEVTVALEGEIPAYFLASAYILNAYDYSPLCAAYETPIYTKEMQELLASDINDYDADRVLNLDDDPNTNFMVFAETTKVIPYVEGANRLITNAQNKTGYYVINPSEEMLSLQVGDVLAYERPNGEYLFAKITEVVNGAVFGFTCGELEMNDVFSHVKIESTGKTGEFSADSTTADEGVTFNGLRKNNQFAGTIFPNYVLKSSTPGVGKEIEIASDYLEYKFDREAKNQDETASVTLDGALGLSVSVNFDCLITLTRQFMELRADANMYLDVTVTGTYKDTIKLGKLYFYPMAGVSVGFAPELQLSFSGKIRLTVTIDMAVGFGYDNKNGFYAINEKPKPEAKLTGDMKAYIGIDFKPTIAVAEGAALTASVKMPIGATLTANLCGKVAEGTEETGDSTHSCNACLDMLLSFDMRLSAEMQFLRMEALTLKTKEITENLGAVDLYYSLDNNKLGTGDCPYRAFCIAITVQDENGFPVSAVAISSPQTGNWGSTNNSGVLVRYLPQGTYTVQATVDGTTVSKVFQVTGPASVLLKLNQEEKEPYIPEDLLVRPGTRLDAGACGDGTCWAFYSSGLLYIYGNGRMEYTPWRNSYKSKVKFVLIDNGVQNIASDAFYECANLTNVTICDDVEEIGRNAFRKCTRLRAVVIPRKVSLIDEFAFYGCGALLSVEIKSDNIIIEAYAFDECSYLEKLSWREGVQEIGNHAFAYCKLRNLSIPNSVKLIGAGAFRSCELLENVTIGSSVKTIGSKAFQGCDRLKNIVIPESVNYIDSYAFAECDELQTAVIGGNNLKIGDSVFYYCSKLEEVTLREGTNTIGSAAFEGCGSLKEIKIPDSVTKIGADTFKHCDSLQSISLGNGLEEIGNYAFEYCESLSNITIPKSVAKIGDYTFAACSGLKKVIINSTDVNIGSWTFCNCENLEEVHLSEGVNEIGHSSFYGCDSLKEITIPDNMLEISSQLFYGCGSLESVKLGRNIRMIYGSAFRYCKSLTSIGIPENVIEIGNYAFGGCDDLKYILFSGNAPLIKSYAFSDTTTTCYYPASDASWTESVKQNYGGKITWSPTYFSAGPLQMVQSTQTVPVSVENAKRVENQENTITSTFEDLIPGRVYTFLVVKQDAIEDILQPENLLYIKQAVAAEDGTLTLNYIPREPTELSYVMVCGGAEKDLKDATITIPYLRPSEEPKVVNPKVEYDGKVLEEGLDYVLTGSVTYTEPGQYTFYVRGIYDYTGTVECVYTVTEGGIPGDVDGNEILNTDDAVYLLLHVLFGSNNYPLVGWTECDFDHSGATNTDDAVYLLLHVLFGAENYPLN